MSDQFSGNAVGLSSPLIGAFSITPADGTDLAYVTREIYFAGAGNVVIVWAGGLETTEPVAAGDRLPWRATRIKATGTTATGIRGYF